MVVAGLDTHDPRLLCRTKADGEHRAERDRHLAEDVPGKALADDAVDPVDELDRLDATLEHGEECAFAALVRRELAGHEADVGRRPGEPLAVALTECGKGRDLEDLVRRYHSENATASARPGCERSNVLRGRIGRGDAHAEVAEQPVLEPVDDSRAR